MNQDTKDVLGNEGEAPKLSSGLNVLTILTFIGCALGLYNAVSSYLGGEESLKKLDEAQGKLADAPAWAKKLAGPEVREMVEKSLDNKVPILIISLVGIALCIYGALEMRKLKKQGYILWLIGEVLPIVATIFFVGSVFFQTVYAFILIFPAIFILLYTLQRKNLRY